MPTMEGTEQSKMTTTVWQQSDDDVYVGVLEGRNNFVDGTHFCFCDRNTNPI